jgi:hypothetical protein
VLHITKPMDFDKFRDVIKQFSLLGAGRQDTCSREVSEMRILLVEDNDDDVC